MDDEDLLNTQEYENEQDDEILSSVGSNVITTDEANSEEEEENDDDDDSGYYAQFIWPSESDSFDDDEDFSLEDHLTSKQMILVNKFEDEKYQRTKRSNKKLSARCQIKSKHVQSIKNRSHNKQLYIHHRLFKLIQLDPPSRNYLPTNSLAFQNIIRDQPRNEVVKKTTTTTKSVPSSQAPNQQFREFTITEHNIPNEPTFDDMMITFLLEMQNRDLTPNDYEMLLRLDERVQRKTVNVNHLAKLPTIKVSDIHLNEQCSICMESYILGEELKLLPCQHIFHTNCIETYLKQFSIQCPLDNLPLT